jgi:hypothetical protein
MTDARHAAAPRPLARRQPPTVTSAAPTRINGSPLVRRHRAHQRWWWRAALHRSARRRRRRPIANAHAARAARAARAASPLPRCAPRRGSAMPLTLPPATNTRGTRAADVGRTGRACCAPLCR